MAYRISGYDSAEVQLVLIATDAEETCAKGKLTPVPPPNGTRMFMIVVANRESGMRYFQQFSEATKRWKDIAPWITLLRPNQLDQVLK